MVKEYKGIMAMFRRNGSIVPANKKEKSKQDNSKKMVPIHTSTSPSEDIRKLTMAETYDMMCRSMERFTREAIKLQNNIEVMLAKHNLPLHKDLNKSLSHNSVSVQGRKMPGSAEKQRDAPPNGRREAIFAVDVQEDMGDASLSDNENEEDEDSEASDEDTVQSVESDRQSLAEPKWRERSRYDVIDVHQLLTPAMRDTPVSDFSRRYLDLASYIPSLSALSKGVIKARLCSRLDQARERWIGKEHNKGIEHWEAVFLPSWLNHKTLNTHVPPAVTNQMINIMLSGNKNNNHPINSEESDHSNALIIAKSKYPTTAEMPTEQKAKTENKKSKHREASTSTERKETKKCNRYFLAPVGSISTQGLPTKGFPKWTDVATIIHHGTNTHTNLRLRRESLLTTLPADMPTPVLMKLKCYSVRPIKMPMTSLKTLMDINATSRIFAETHAKFVCVNILLALQFLHNHDVFHGSVCPAKIVFNDKGYPCLIGFGTADIIDERQGRPREKQEIGYTSVEQIFLEYVTQATDIFSLGAVVYAMVYGTPPHQGSDFAETRRNIMNNKFVPAFAPEEMTPEGRRFIINCIRKEDMKRFSLLHMKKNLFETVAWFQRLTEEKIYRQTIPSPILHVMKNL